MGIYVLSVMSKQDISEKICNQIEEKLRLLYPENTIGFSKYYYEDRVYREVDFDIQGITFHKETINEGVNLLVQAIIVIFNHVNVSCEVIGGYNDTENAIIQYEEDREKNYKNFGIFGTKTAITGGIPYCEEEGITIYQSFEYDGMGVIF